MKRRRSPPPSPQTMWRLINSEQDVDRAIDMLFNFVDDLLIDWEFEAVDAFIQRTNVEELSKEMAVALLSITLAAKEKLLYREELYYQIKKELKSYFEHDEIDRLLKGLH